MGQLLPFVILLLWVQASTAKASGPNLPLVRFQGCYDRDTCMTTDSEKVRLACIDAPEIKQRPRLRAIKMSPTADDNTSSMRSADSLRALVLG